MRARDDVVEMVLRLVVLSLIVAAIVRDPLPRPMGGVVAANQERSVCGKETP